MPDVVWMEPPTSLPVSPHNMYSCLICHRCPLFFNIKSNLSFSLFFSSISDYGFLRNGQSTGFLLCVWLHFGGAAALYTNLVSIGLVSPSSLTSIIGRFPIDFTTSTFFISCPPPNPSHRCCFSFERLAIYFFVILLPSHRTV